MDERDATLERLASGAIEVVTNCMVLTEGWDMPALGCLILARPTMQMGLYRQMIGRGLRPAPDKFNCVVIDHSGATYRLGFAEDATSRDGLRTSTAPGSETGPVPREPSVQVRRWVKSRMIAYARRRRSA